MANLFDFSRCPNPPASPTKIADYTVVHDCTVPAVPAPIYQCQPPPLSPPGPIGPAGFDTFGGRWAVTDQYGISPYNHTTRTLGVGHAMLQHADPTTGTMVDDYTTLVYTDSTTGVPGNTLIQLKMIEGMLAADVVPCGAGVYA